MPIRAEMRGLYPANWKEISEEIRFGRGGGRCEWCGAKHGEPHPVTGSLVVLTCAHLDQDPANNDPDNLAGLCQRCHNRHDLPFRLINRRVTLRRRRAIGDLFPV